MSYWPEQQHAKAVWIGYTCWCVPATNSHYLKNIIQFNDTNLSSFFIILKCIVGCFDSWYDTKRNKNLNLLEVHDFLLVQLVLQDPVINDICQASYSQAVL